MTCDHRFVPFVAALLLSAAVSAPAGAQDQPAAGFAREVFGTFAFDSAFLASDSGGFISLSAGGGVRLRRQSPLAWEFAVSRSVAGAQAVPVGGAAYRVVDAITVGSVNLSYFFFGRDGERRAAPFAGGGAGVMARHDLTNLTFSGGRAVVSPQPRHDTRWDAAFNAAGGVRIVVGTRMSITPEVRLYLSGSPFTLLRASVSAGYHW